MFAPYQQIQRGEEISSSPPAARPLEEKIYSTTNNDIPSRHPAGPPMSYAATSAAGTNYPHDSPNGGGGGESIKYDLDGPQIPGGGSLQQQQQQHHGLPLNQQQQTYQFNPQQHHPQQQSLHHHQNPIYPPSNSHDAHHEDLMQHGMQQHNGLSNGMQMGMQNAMQNGGIQNGTSNTNQNGPTTNGSDGSAKGNRLRKACDSCSIRKVKCDESGPPCRACAALDIPCTFERPSRRRGPPNRHAEAIKKRRLESPGGAFSPVSPSNVAATLASFSSHAVLSAESICPFSTLELLVDDFFTYIHPLCPFPHEPSFRAAFKHREDLQNPSFLALLASMVGTLVASFPRKPRLHLKAQHREKLFPNSLSLVERCHKVAVEARGPGYLDKGLTVYDAATSYFLGLAGAYTINWKQCRLYFSETLTIIRAIGAHKLRDPGYYSVGQLPTVMGSDRPQFEGVQGEPIDYIRQEIGRRIFWVVFVGIRSMQQLGVSFGELVICPPTPSEPYPPFPLEVDDQYIYVDHVDPQPADVISELVGFNLGVSIYNTVTPIATMEMAYGIDEIFDLNRQRRILEDCLQNVKKTLDNAPRELILHPTGDLEPMRERSYYPPAQDLPGARGVGDNIRPVAFAESAPDDRRWIQHEIQKANIYSSQLGTRSYIVEKFWNLLDANARLKNSSNPSSSQGSPILPLDGILPKSESNASTGTPQSTYDLIEIQMSSERENIVKDLLRVLATISQVNMEPNGGSFINKIRQIASTLLDTPRNRKGPLAIKAEDYLARFLDILMKLEWISPNSTSSPGSNDPNASAGAMSKEDEEEEQLRNWADLREYQTRFAQNGGFLDF